jgi:hypothetical protein
VLFTSTKTEVKNYATSRQLPVSCSSDDDEAFQKPLNYIEDADDDQSGDESKNNKTRNRISSLLRSPSPTKP